MVEFSVVEGLILVRFVIFLMKLWVVDMLIGMVLVKGWLNMCCSYDVVWLVILG